MATHPGESDYTGPHSICWAGEDFEHRCQQPSGRRCIDCGEPAGTLWGPIWCPDCDVIRLGNVSRQMESLLSSPPVQAALDTTSSVSRQHYIDTGEYLRVCRTCHRPIDTDREHIEAGRCQDCERTHRLTDEVGQ